MSKTKFYNQCTLLRGTTRTVSWIPSEFAVVGKTLKFREDDIWVDGWLVIEVGGQLDAKYVEEHERDYTKNRNASDI